MNTQPISTVGQVLSSIRTPDATFAIVETSASNAGRWGGYVNLRLVRVTKGSVYKTPRSRGVQVLNEFAGVYGRCRGDRSGYAHAVSALNKQLATLA